MTAEGCGESNCSLSTGVNCALRAMRGDTHKVVLFFLQSFFFHQLMEYCTVISKKKNNFPTG